MADDKNKDKVETPAEATDDQKSTGPAATAIPAKGSETATYYLRPGKTHMALVKGERTTLDQAGQPAELNEVQYGAMRDKFFTKEEYAAFRKSPEAPADGASAPAAPDPATMEQASVEAHQNAANEPTKGKDTPAGETSVPPKK